VAGVYDGQQVQLWVDGAVKFTTNVTGKLVVKPGPITINQPDTFSFPGALDDVLVYSRALSGAEIGELARGGAPP
jgi:hypothetical protein